MPQPRFHWHDRARIFAGAHPLAQAPATDPVAARLHSLQRTLGRAPFCIGDGPGPDLRSLRPGQFATLTGGTSGAPKVIVRSEASWIASFECNAAAFGYGPADGIAVLGALTHSLALYGLLEAVHLGLAAHVLHGLSPAAQARAMHTARCTVLYATPTQLRLLPAGTTLPHLRLILCGGGALALATRAHVAALCPHATLHVFYGAAETSFVTLGCGAMPEGSVGRAYGGVEIDVRNPDAGGTGEIWVRSPYLFERYLGGGSSHTRRAEGWLTVGERGHLDAQGYLHLRGRAGRIVTIADQTVYPDAIEAHLATLPGMRDCAVLAQRDALRGHRLVAVLEGAEDPALAARLRAHCTASGLIAPRHVHFLDPFPRLPSGKPDLKRIAALTGCEA